MEAAALEWGCQDSWLPPKGSELGEELGEAWTPEGQFKDRQEKLESFAKPEAHQQDPTWERGDLDGVLGTSPTVTQVTHGSWGRAASQERA